MNVRPKVPHLFRVRMAMWLMQETEGDVDQRWPLLQLVPLVPVVVQKAWAVGIRERLPELTVESFTETDRTGGRASDKRRKMELEELYKVLGVRGILRASSQ